MAGDLLERALDLLPPSPLIRAAALLVAFVLLAKIADWIGTRLLTRWSRKSQTDLDDRLVEASVSGWPCPTSSAGPTSS